MSAPPASTSLWPVKKRKTIYCSGRVCAARGTKRYRHIKQDRWSGPAFYFSRHTALGCAKKRAAVPRALTRVPFPPPALPGACCSRPSPDIRTVFDRPYHQWGAKHTKNKGKWINDEIRRYCLDFCKYFSRCWFILILDYFFEGFYMKIFYFFNKYSFIFG